jgi:hypothetical protein
MLELDVLNIMIGGQGSEDTSLQIKNTICGKDILFEACAITDSSDDIIIDVVSH